MSCVLKVKTDAQPKLGVDIPSDLHSMLLLKMKRYRELEHALRPFGFLAPSDLPRNDEGGQACHSNMGSSNMD